MSRLSELLAEHCPQGVDFKALGEVGTFLRGSGLQKKDFVEAGVGCIHYGEIYKHYGTTTSKTRSFVSPEHAAKLKTAEHGDLIITTTSENEADVCKAVAWMGAASVAFGGHSCAFQHDLDPAYAAYYFQTAAFHAQKRKFVWGTKVKDIKTADLATIRIPVPPRPVQAEIARILDESSALTIALIAELEAESLGRTKQHHQYRRTLLARSTAGVPVRDLGEVVTNKDRERRPVTRAAREAGPFPYYGANGVQDHVAGFLFDGTFLLVGEDGSVTRPDGTPVLNWAEGKIWVNNHAHVLGAGSGEIPLRFLYHYLQTVDISVFVTGSAQPKLNQANLNKIPIPVPERSAQLQVVDHLDAAEMALGGLRADLRHEVTLRQKQFEYYREMLFVLPVAVVAESAA